jgi:hypothetical protein
VPDSVTDLAGLKVSAEDLLAALLETAAQPIWVVDPDDVIRRDGSMFPVAYVSAPIEMPEVRVFVAIRREVAELLSLPAVLILRYGPDETATVLAAWGERTHRECH